MLGLHKARLEFRQWMDTKRLPDCLSKVAFLNRSASWPICSGFTNPLLTLNVTFITKEFNMHKVVVMFSLSTGPITQMDLTTMLGCNPFLHPTTTEGMPLSLKRG